MAFRTNEEIQWLLSEFEYSKESKVQFCKRNKIGTATLYRWQVRAKKAESGEPVRLLPVVSAIQPQHPMLELIITRKISLRFSQNNSAQYIADIIKAIGR